MRAEDLDYHLPEDLIAQRPAARREDARLLVVRGDAVEHRSFADLPDLLPEGALIVLNDTRVVPARLVGRKAGTGGRVELLCVRPAADGRWWCLGQASKGLRAGQVVELPEAAARARIVGVTDDGVVVAFEGAPVETILARAGRVPLPPYIRREDDAADRDRYQTVYARAPGAVAAPTAGLHFSDALLARVRERFEVAAVTLHVGPGTFLPLRGEPDAHRVPPEPYAIAPATAAAIERARGAGRPVVAVGTTVVRALEAWRATGRAEGETDLVIRPGHRFLAVDALITNFHLPRTSLLMLVFAFAGRERVLAAYREAVRERYRFYSYGDAMLVLPLPPGM